MYRIRPHAAVRPRKYELIDISSSGENIPLQRDWLSRKCTLRSPFESFMKQFYNFEVFGDDVFVLGFPKSGTTWMQEAAWLLLNDLNFTKAKEIEVLKRSVFLEWSALVPLQRNSVEMAAALPGPRLIKTHLPANLMPTRIWQKKAKIIYVARNPKDVVVSTFYFRKGLGLLNCTFDERVDDFINSDNIYAPYWSHVSDFWHMRDQSQIFFTTYENMKVDLKCVLIRLNKFLGKPVLSDENLNKLMQHLDFENMKANTKASPTQSIKKIDKEIRKDLEFMRRGIIGSYRDELSEENQRKINEWSKKCCEAENVNENEIFGVL